MAEIYSDINQAVLRNVPKGSSVLDVGCGTGTLGAELRKKNCTVFGIEYSKESADLASKRLNKVILSDIESEIPKIDRKFDVIIFADVLEHLKNPETVLKSYLRFIKPSGIVVISLPNIANWTIRLKLLFGNLTPTETGILDKTHLHFYTLKTAKRMIESVGLKISRIDLNPNFVRSAVMFGIKGGNHQVHEQLLNSKAFKFYTKIVLPIETLIARLWRKMFSYQFIFVARKK